jgi:hypothetical protein
MPPRWLYIIHFLIQRCVRLLNISYVRTTVAPFPVIAVPGKSIKVTVLSLATRKLGSQFRTFVVHVVFCVGRRLVQVQCLDYDVQTYI